MKYKIKEINKCTKELLIEVDGEQIAAGYTAYYNKIKPSASVPGFRKGKAPREILEKYYAHEAHDGVLRDLVAVNYDKAIADEKLHPFGYPTFSDIDYSETKLSFKATIELKPEFDIKKYKGLKAKKNSIVVADTEIDEALERIRSAYATQKVVEGRAVKSGDFVVVDARCEVDGVVVDDRKNDTMEVNDKTLLPEYVKNLTGASVGDEKKFEIAFPETIPQEDMKGKTGHFTIAIKEIKEKVLPDLDENFLKMVGEYEKIEDMKDALRKDIEARKQQEEDRRVERELLDAICKTTSFDMPQSLIVKRKEKMIEDMKQNMLSRGMPESEFEKQQKNFDKEAQNEAERQVQVAFILDKIAMIEDVSVTEDDISGKFYELSRAYQQPVEVIRDYYEKNDMIESLSAELRNDKVVALIKNESIEK